MWYQGGIVIDKQFLHFILKYKNDGLKMPVDY
jgi:hypothetical protein